MSWLHDDKKGEILPFALLGSGNNEIKEEIEKIEGKIKDLDIELGTLNKDTESFDENTLYFKQSKKKIEFDNAIRHSGNLETDLTRRISNKANQDIKKNPNFLNQKNSSSYNVNSLYTDIDYIRNNNLDCLLSDDEEIQIKVIIKEEDKESISHLPNINPSFRDYINKTKKLLTKGVGLSLELKELIENDLLQDWIKTGHSLHKQSGICAFCKNPISETRRKELDGHFSKESEELEQNIQTLLNQLESLKTTIESHLTKYNIKKDRFYVVLYPKYEEIYSKWNDAIDKQNEQIKILKDKLSERFKNLFTPIIDIDFSELETNTIDFESIINDFNSLIIENNNKKISIEEDKDNARKTLRNHAVKNFLSDIDYDALLDAIEKAKQEKEKIEEEFKQFEPIISKKIDDRNKLKKQIEELKTKLDDQSLAAEKINEHLRNFFGHDSIQLKPDKKQIADEIKTRFVVKRGDEQAMNLSEGECSLVAFCYFMARIEDEIQSPDAKDKLIIYIDDPISSLDSNHIFFMYSLIESITVGVSKDNPKFCQLFVSTHNIEFLKHLSNLHHFDNKSNRRSNLIIEKHKKGDVFSSVLSRMPRYLRINISEYLYLFDEIYKFANIENLVTDESNSDTRIYIMGNVMRRFLEAYMSTKYPHIDSPFKNLNLLFPNSIPYQINRLVQTFSHLQGGTRVTIPIDPQELKETAIRIVKAIKSNDPVHYDSLVNCINKVENA